MDSFQIILFLLFIILLKACYEYYQLYKLIYFDEKCFSFKKIIVDKFDLNNYYENNNYLYNQANIRDFMNNNYKCIFNKFNPNSHIFNNEVKSEIIFKCYC